MPLNGNPTITLTLTQCIACIKWCTVCRVLCTMYGTTYVYRTRGMQATPHDTINTMYYLCITTSRSVLLHHCTWEYTNTECIHNILYLSLMHCMLCIQRAWRVYYRTTHYMHGVHGVHAVVCRCTSPRGYVCNATHARAPCVTLTHPL